MPRVNVRPFESRDIAHAASLRAARHARDRERLPELPARFESPEAWAGRLAGLLEDSRASGAVAEREGHVSGFLFGRQQLVAPASMMAKFSSPRSISLDAFAVAEGEHATDVLGALYGALAEEWVDAGFFDHTVTTSADDAACDEAWAAMGFGRSMVLAARDTGLPVVRGETPLEVRRATREDLGLVARMTELSARHHRQPPMFWPYLREVFPALHAFEEHALGDSANAAFFAERDGTPLAMHLFLASGFGGETYTPEGSVYLFEAVTAEEARGEGLGSGLLAATMAWAREQGYRQCTLHYASANNSARSFWLKHGFRPLSHGLARHIDDRVAWARP